jgi:NADPH:quinone reductase-like Zn-dependent oxidoreductase
VEVSRADGFVPGDDVLGITTSGGYAEYATASATAIALKPEGLSHAQAASLPVSGMTAWQALVDRGRLEPGQTALIAGAAGGVGHLAVQFAKHAGARVIGTGSSRNREFVLRLGADEFIDYTRGDVADAVSGVDLALDTVGGATTASLLPTLREGGTLVTIAYPPEKPPQDCRLLGEAPDHEAKLRAAPADRQPGRVRRGTRRDRGGARASRCPAGTRTERVWARTRKDRSYRPGSIQDLQPITLIVGNE